MTTTTTTTLREVPDDPYALYELSVREGWGDGVPIIAPTDDRVQALLEATVYAPGHVHGTMPPRFGAVTTQLIAVNAALAGVEPAAFGHVVEAVRGVVHDDFAAVAITTTTAGAHPWVIANGPSRDRLGIDYQGGCLGGAGGRGSMTIGRAVSLVIRNVGGQKANATSKTVFGQPARFGFCFGEWEERSPWPSLAERAGLSKDVDAVTVHTGVGTHALYDDQNTEPREKAYMLAKGSCYFANSVLQAGWDIGQFVILINPIWAARMGNAFTEVSMLQEVLWENAWQPLDAFPRKFQGFLEERGHVENGKVRLAAGPEQFFPIVAGGLGSHQGVLLNSFGDTLMQTREIPKR